MFRGRVHLFIRSNPKEFHPGVSPLEQAKRKGAQGVDIAKARKETVSGLIQAIEATKKRMAEYGAYPDLEYHLKNLEEWLERTKRD